ncbi:MAG: polysaccharide deacetylase [Paenibacillus sp.]|jgi:probable sporulation protein (polysaccharide deacetylase family)|nr:polysaccharide deacetylase [Paenibacillus sp.]
MTCNNLLIKGLILGLSCSLLPSQALANDISHHSYYFKKYSTVPTGSLERPDLLQFINNEASKRNAPPTDAKIDGVWKAIPGYNGIQIDIEKTYDLNIGVSDFNSIQYVFKEIPPKIRLEDLGVQPIYRGNPEKPMVSLMINVAWGNEYIPHILKVLEQHNVKTTFFFDGSWLKKNVDVAKEIASHGHELSNHAYSHKNMSQLGRNQAIAEISKTEKLLQSQLNVQNSLFAPPSGDYDMETVQIAHELKLKTILWTLDTLDWRNPTPDSIVQKIDRKVQSGYLILMHPTKSSSQALDGMIRAIERKGLRIGTVSEVISERRIQP